MGWNIRYYDYPASEVVSGVPVWSAAPAFVIQEGIVSSHSLGVTVEDGSSITVTWVQPGSKPAWVEFSPGNPPSITFQGDQLDANDIAGLVLRATANGQAVDSDSGYISVIAASSAVATFTLTASAATTDAPFAFGHAFKEGDIPLGYVPYSSDATDWQATVLTRWPDSSVKHAIIAGRATTVNGNTLLSIAPAIDPGGTALTEANLASALPTTTIAAGAFTWTLNDSVGTSDLHRTACSGPVMSNFIYRKAVTGNDHLVLWADVRIYKGGNVEIFPWVENAYFLVANPTNDVRTYAISIGGAQMYSQSIDVKHHTRVPLVTGSTFSYWTGADPGIMPWHDRTYLMATKLVPNYGWLSPSEATLNGLSQSYAPNTLAGISSSMGVAGSSAAIINNAQAFYVTSNGDARAYKAAVVFGLSGGSWSTHYRDENTNEPIRFSTYHSASLNAGSNITIPGGTGGTNGTPVTTHQPSFGYLPFLITGRWWFWEESAFWATWNYLRVRPNSRRGESRYETAPFLFANGSAGVINPSDGTYANRGAHWSIRLLAQTLAVCPSSHAIYGDLVTAWESNTDFYKQTFVDGTFSAGWVSPQGFLGDYSADGTSAYGTPGGVNAWWGAGWMSTFGVQTWGYSSEIGLPQSAASEARHLAVRNHAYKQVVQRAGDGTSYNWRRFGVYSYPLGSDGTGLPPEAWFTDAQSYAAYLSGNGLASIPATAGLSLKQHSSDSDLTGADSTSLDYFPFALSALAYAVDHSATGAAAGWDRIVGASNFGAVSAAWHNNPAHAIVPRISVAAPSYISSMSDFQVRQLTGAYTPTNGKETMASVTPSEWLTNDPGIVKLSSVITAWSGGAKGSGTTLIVHGGGHADSANNGLYIFDYSGTAAPTGWTVAGQSSVSAVYDRASPPATYEYSDGSPCATHTYDSMVRAGNKLYRMGGGFYANAGGFYGRCYSFDLETSSWSGLVDFPLSIAAPSHTVYHAATDKILFFGSGNGNCGFFRCATGVWGATRSNPTEVGYYACPMYDSSRARVVVVGASYGGVPVNKIVTPNWTAETLTGAAFTPSGATEILSESALSGFYDAAKDCFWIWGGSSTSPGYANIYRMDAATFAISAYPLSQSMANFYNANYRGSYGRWVFMDTWRAIGFATRHDQAPYVIKLPN